LKALTFALPSQAAEIVLANMLTEVMEAVPRFHPGTRNRRQLMAWFKLQEM